MAPRPRCPKCDVPLTEMEQIVAICGVCGWIWQTEVSDQPPIVVRIAEAPPAIPCPQCEELRSKYPDLACAVWCGKAVT